MNRVILVGRLTRDPELRNTNSGVPVASFTIAVNRTFASANGEREADFINCIAFNKQAENLQKFIKKGGLVGVDGRIQTRNYNAADGSKRYVTEVICENVHFLEPKSSGANQNSFPEYDDITPYNVSRNQKQQPSPYDDIQSQYNVVDDDDDLGF